MEYINECIRKTPVADECDVFIAGGGIAGVAAALGAARQGVRVILSEQQWALGGLATLGLVTIFLPLCDGRGNHIIHGICKELFMLSIKYGYEDRYPKAWLENGSREEKENKRFDVQFNPQLFAIAMEELLLKEGVKILYGSKVIEVVKDGGRIKHIIIDDREGIKAIRAGMVVDATGDADICRLSEEILEKYTKNRFAAWYYTSDNSGYKLSFDAVPPNGNCPVNEPMYDGTKSEDLNRLMFRVHKHVLNKVLAKRENDGNIMPVTMQTIPPVRMTRRLKGAYELDETEVFTNFNDSIGTTTDWRKPGPVFAIPYRCLYGKTGNLLTAGRCISVTTSMWDITRCIPTCAVTGEAAGIAAALAFKEKTDVQNTDIKKIQKELVSNGVSLDINLVSCKSQDLLKI